MHERKKIIRQNITRESQDEKLKKAIKEALKNKPTASFLNSQGISPSGLPDTSNIPNNKQVFLNDKLVRNSKNRKRFTAPRMSNILNENLISFMNAPSLDSSSREMATPDWFRNTELVDISVIVPLYKSNVVIKELINSWVLDCDYKVEIIFIDDVCPQNSKQAVLDAWTLRKEELKRPVGKIICNDSNKGYGMTCNAGVSFALGKYLIFLNADTKVTPRWIEPMIELFNDPQVGLVGNMHLKDGGGHHGTIVRVQNGSGMICLLFISQDIVIKNKVFIHHLK